MSGAYAVGQAVAVVLAVLMVLVGLYYLVRGGGSARPQSS